MCLISGYAWSENLDRSGENVPVLEADDDTGVRDIAFTEIILEKPESSTRGIHLKQIPSENPSLLISGQEIDADWKLSLHQLNEELSINELYQIG